MNREHVHGYEFKRGDLCCYKNPREPSFTLTDLILILGRDGFYYRVLVNGVVECFTVIWCSRNLSRLT